MKIQMIILLTLMMNHIHPLAIQQTPSPNFNERKDIKTHKIITTPLYIILHYTSGCTSDSALWSLSNFFRPVSSHYIISENGTISQLVDESKRAWHAGISSWKKNKQINSYSIGIEIVNPGFSEKDKAPCIANTHIWNKHNGAQVAGSDFIWYPFTKEQINSVITLCKEIIVRYNIKPECVLGHSDIAPGRKVDPGPLFPWHELAQHGVGIWYQTPISTINDPNSIISIQTMLNEWGYKTPLSKTLDPQTEKVIQAFQMHFRPSNINGIPDQETIAILRQLLNKS